MIGGMSKKFHLLWAVFPLLIAILLYGYTVRIPFYLDDIPNFQIVTEGDGIEQWDGDPAFPYYRPMTFSVWKLVDEIISPRQPAVYHWLNVLLFGATGVLIGQIAYHLSQKSRGAMGIAGTAFIIFPFSYQAVIWISSFFHILTGFAVCLSLWASVRWLQKRAGFPILMLVWFSALAGTFAHENGVLLLPFMVGLVMVRAFRVRPNFWRTAAILLPVIALSGVYLGLRYSVPHAAEAYITRNVSPNFTASYFLQGLGYPTHAAARRILGYGEASPYINLSMALTIGLAGLTLVLVWFRAPRLMLPALFGLGWYLIAAIPSIFFLELNYTLGSPRLMYISALGASLFWGAALGGLLHSFKRLWRNMVLTLLAVPVLVSLPFLSARREEMLLQSQYGWQLIDVVESHLIYNDQQVLLVNAPAYLSPHKTTFLLGTEGSVFMLNGSDYNAFVRLNTNQPAAAPFDRVAAHLESIKYKPFNFTPQNSPIFGEELYSTLDQTDHVIVTYFQGKDFYPVYTGGHAATLPGAPQVAYPEIGLSLLHAEAHFASDQQTITILTQWEIDQPAPVRVFVHAFCGAEFVGQADGDLWGNLYPISEWESRQPITDIRQIFLSSPVDEDCLQLSTGVYWVSNIVRLSPLDLTTQQPFANDVIPIESVIQSDIPFFPRQ